MSIAGVLDPAPAFARIDPDEGARGPDIPVELGEVIAGRYRIDRVLASGGMGVVCLGEHIELEQPIAIKFLRPELSQNASIVQRFLNEARAAAVLQSPHVVRVMDVGQLASGRPYLVMERLHGVDLDELVERRGALPVGEALDYVVQALEALAEAHAAGIIHRDIKPENLFLCDERSGGGGKLVKIVDFGLAKRLDHARGKVLTGPQDAMGSPCYMSPEQVKSPATVDARTDLWSMGVVLYRLLTGVLPFQGDTLEEVCSHVLYETPPPVSKLRRELGADLDAIVVRCLQRSPARRYGSAEELRAALLAHGATRVAGTEPTRTPRYVGPSREGRWEGGLAVLFLSVAAAFGVHRQLGIWPGLLPEVWVLPTAGSHAARTPSLSFSFFPTVSDLPGRAPGSRTTKTASGRDALAPAVHGLPPEAPRLPEPEPSFDAAARASITEGGVDGAGTMDTPGPLEESPSAGEASPTVAAPTAGGSAEPLLTPEEVERRKRAYRVYLEGRGLTLLREVLGPPDDAAVPGRPPEAGR